MSVADFLSSNVAQESEFSYILAPAKGALKPPAAAAFLGISKDTLAHWRGGNKGPAYVQFGRSISYRVETLEAFLRKHERGGAS